MIAILLLAVGVAQALQAEIHVENGVTTVAGPSDVQLQAGSGTVTVTQLVETLASVAAHQASLGQVQTSVSELQNDVSAQRVSLEGKISAVANDLSEAVNSASAARQSLQQGLRSDLVSE